MRYEERTKEQLITECRETAESLRRSEQEFSLLVDNIPAMVFRGYTDWAVDFHSDRVEDITGYSRADFDSRRLKWAQLILEEDIDQAKKIFIRALKRDRSYVREYRIRRKDGEIIWIEERSHIVCDPDGRIEYVSGLFFDVTDRVLTEESAAKNRETVQEMLMELTYELKRANERLRQAGLHSGELGPIDSQLPKPVKKTGVAETEAIIQARLRLAEFTCSHSLEELLRATLDEAEAMTGSEIGFYHFLEADQKTLSLQTWSTGTLRGMCTSEGSGLHYDVSRAGVWVDCILERRPVIHNDYSALPHRKGMPPGHAQVIRELVVPVLRGSKIMAILGVGNKPQDYNEKDIETVSVLADLAWDLVERKRAEEKLHESLTKYKVLFDTFPLGVIITDEQGHILEANAESERLLGVSRQEQTERTLASSRWRIVSREGTPMPYEETHLYQAMRDQQPAGSELGLVKPSGEIAWLAVTAAPIPLEGYGIAVAFGDISERVRVENILMSRVRRQQAIAMLGLKALSDDDLGVLTDEAVTLVAETLGVEYVEILELLPASDTLRLRSGFGWKEDLVGKATVGTEIASQAGYTLLSHEPVVVEDLSAETRFTGPPLLLEHNVVSGMTVIIGSTVQPFGVLGAHTSTRKVFSRDEVYFLQTVANVLATAINRKHAEETVRKSEERLRFLVEDSLTGIFIIQNDRIAYVNPAQKRITGSAVEEGGPLRFDRIHPDDVEEVKALYSRMALEEIHAADTTFRFYPIGESQADQNVKWLHCRASVIEYLGNPGILLNVMDITRLKEMEHLLRIEDKMSSLGRVAAGLAHELRNPVSGITIHLTNLERTCSDLEDGDPEALGKTREIITELKLAAERIEMVVRRVMDFARPGITCVVAANINRSIEEAMKLSSASLRQSGIRVEKDLAPDLPECRVEAQFIERVLMNLITNAMQAMQKTEGAKMIELRSLAEEDHVLIKVSDSGPGVPLQLRDKIFDPFFTTQNSGIGIGLSLCHRIISDHGGTLDVSTSRWGGAEFTIKIPIDKRSVKR